MLRLRSNNLLLRGGATEGYSARVRRHSFHRWALIFLLVSKLIIGELALAHPMLHEALPEKAVAAMTNPEESPCPDHLTTSETGDSDAAKSMTEDCCKGGSCECVCVHVPAAATAWTGITRARLPQDEATPAAEGVVWRRPYSLFRPPA